MRANNLSIFFPAFNEEKNIALTTERTLQVLEQIKIKNYEVLIINDGSRDQTEEVANELAKRHKGVKVISQPNGGYGAALQSGFYKSKYDWIVYTDADGQFDFGEVTKFLEKADEADLIIGYRIKRQDPAIRIFFAKGWGLLLFIFFGLKLKDVDCGFKMINREVLNKIPKLESTRGAMINAELVIKAEKNDFIIAQVGVTHHPRLFGKPTGASLKVIVNSFFDLLKMWIKYS